MAVLFWYKDREMPKNIVERNIELMYKSQKFDVNICSSNGIVSGHRFILSLFSKFFRELLTTSSISNSVFIRKCIFTIWFFCLNFAFFELNVVFFL